MATPYQGGAALGDILFGGRDRGNSDVFLKRLRENYSTQKAMEDASTAQIQRIARESQTAETVAKATGLPLGQAAMIANALQSQDSMNLNTAGVTPLQMQEYGLKNRAVDSLAPEMGMGNAALAAIDGKPLKRNEIDSGYQLDPYAVGGDATPTETENAKIGELGARANLSNVKAKGGGYAPSRRGGGGGKDMTPQEAEAKQAWILAQASKKAKAGESPAFVEAWIANEMVKAGFENVVPAPVEPEGKTSGKTSGGTISPEAKARMVRMPGGKTVVKVNTPAEAKNAWAKLKPGAGLMLPNGTIRYKD